MEFKGRELGDGFLVFDGDGDDLADEAEDVFFVVGAVGVAGDEAVVVFGDAVLVDNPIEGAAIAESVFEGFGRDAVEGEETVVDKGALVGCEFHFLDAPVEGGLLCFRCV